MSDETVILANPTTSSGNVEQMLGRAHRRPEAPVELWMLWATDDGGLNGRWLPAIDNPRDAENYLVCFSEADALIAAGHQMDMYSIDEVTPIRVK